MDRLSEVAAEGIADREVWSVLEMLPDGYVKGTYRGRGYAITTESFAQGRSRKLLARELGGSDMISCNLYRTSRGPRLKPCEMPAERVRDFLLNVELQPG